MAKIVKDDFQVVVDFVDGEVSCSAHYSVSSEGVEQKRGTSISLSSQETKRIQIYLMTQKCWFRIQK